MLGGRGRSDEQSRKNGVLREPGEGREGGALSLNSFIPLTNHTTNEYIARKMPKTHNNLMVI